MQSTRSRRYAAVAASLLTLGAAVGPNVVSSPAGAATPPPRIDAAATVRTSTSAAAVAPSPRAIRAEIDRVVAEGSSVSARSTMHRQVTTAVRCAEFLPDARYCLNYGWTDKTEAEVRSDVAGAVTKERAAAAGDRTGDLPVAGTVARATTAPAATRAARDRRELEDAARGIDKYLSLRADATHTSTRAVTYPDRGSILKDRTTEQGRTYWCGPTAMQMIHWNWGTNSRVTQATWASRLGTTTSGSAITSMVRVTNRYTNWDRDAYAGTYVTLDIGGFTYTEWFRLNVKHYATYRAPVILHPILLKRYFPYLDDDGSGHFQVGRGWDYQRGKDDAWLLGYYEPWNQQRFNRSEPYIPRKQWRWAKNSWRANKAHFQHNIGV